jgi:hypothetical protein
MGLRVPKVHEHPIVHVLRHISVMGGDDGKRGSAKGLYEVVGVFRIKLRREALDISKGTTEHGEMPVFCPRHRCRREGSTLG